MNDQRAQECIFFKQLTSIAVSELVDYGYNILYSMGEDLEVNKLSVLLKSQPLTIDVLWVELFSSLDTEVGEVIEPSNIYIGYCKVKSQ